MLLRHKAVLLLILLTACHSLAQVQSNLERRIRQILSVPQLKHAEIGIEIVDLSNSKLLYAINPDKLFVPGSTAKLLTEGAALGLIGPEYRFHTRVFRTGAIATDGTLDGDLVLVAAGDPNLSARVQADDTLTFTNNDHSYAGALPGVAVQGDPLSVLKRLAAQVSAKGVKRVRGRVLVDASMFPSDKTDPGTGVVISPIVVNDNIIDLGVLPGHVGDKTSVSLSPQTSYIIVENRALTAEKDSDVIVRFSPETIGTDGARTTILEGVVPASWQPLPVAYKVKSPIEFAQSCFLLALQLNGIQVDAITPDGARNQQRTADFAPENLIAEHISPPLREEVKVTLKASQNLHAAMTPYLIGSIVGKKSDDAFVEGFARINDYLEKAGLDLSTVSLSDGAGGPGSSITPAAMVRFLSFAAKQSYERDYIKALPVMGKDGTLAETQKQSPAAGHVHAKTGTYVFYDALNRGVLLLGKGLAGYVDARNGHRIVFAAFINKALLKNMDQVEDVAELLGKVASVIYEEAN